MFFILANKKFKKKLEPLHQGLKSNLAWPLIYILRNEVGMNKLL